MTRFPRSDFGLLAFGGHKATTRTHGPPATPNGVVTRTVLDTPTGKRYRISADARAPSHHTEHDMMARTDERPPLMVLDTESGLRLNLDAMLDAARAEERARCIRIVWGQRLSFPSGQYTSIELTYNEAIDDALKALRA